MQKGFSAYDTAVENKRDEIIDLLVAYEPKIKVLKMVMQDRRKTKASRSNMRLPPELWQYMFGEFLLPLLRLQATQEGL